MHTKGSIEEAEIVDVGMEASDDWAETIAALRRPNEVSVEIDLLRSGLTTFEESVDQKGDVSMVMVQPKLAKHPGAARIRSE